MSSLKENMTCGVLEPVPLTSPDRMLKLPLTDADILHYITSPSPTETEDLFDCARRTREERFGRKVYFRALIEITNYCKNGCFYCGIRAENRTVDRYRLSLEQILHCCREGDALGYKSFVLQGGDDPFFTDERVVEIIAAIRAEFPAHAISLSLGERERESYERFFVAGANRYLLRHETANEAHYATLHPADMSLSRRKQCLFDLKEIGFQTGAGFMVGSPYQTPATLAEDLRFLAELKPAMIGIGPFIPARGTPFADRSAGGAELTARMVALARILLPDALIPATTAFASIAPQAGGGRERALAAGANVVMPNLSPAFARERYTIYDNKISSGSEAAASLATMRRDIRSWGFEPDMGRGDAPA